MRNTFHYDVIVIGGGHAGVEAACSSARMGVKTALITISKDNIGVMSCNPAIGGVGKGTLVREIDALDGIMARTTDNAGIHYKMLNKSKGPAVYGPRAQADRVLFQNAIQQIVFNYENLDIIEDRIEEILSNNHNVHGVEGLKATYLAPAIVLTTGTFLRGMIHIGKRTSPAGRIGEEPANKLSESLLKHGFALGRLKTGTPARLHKDSIDYSRCEIQEYDAVPIPMSYMTSNITVPQVPCHITRTTKRTLEVVQDNIKESAVYSGQISGRGPRYCPSIEDKIVRFSHKESHQIFLEPEGLTSDLIYPNGISTSFPEHIQHELIASITGLENAIITQYAYAIEYDYIDPRELTHHLQCKKLQGLFLAGQINGTTGYEEAGGQGLIAGLNAALTILHKPLYMPSRTDSLIGVMIDDLVTHGVSEPYRMFTSRSEYRLLLRPDNAHHRLTNIGIDVGCVSNNRKMFHVKHFDEYQTIKNLLIKKKATPHELKKYGITIKQDGIHRSAFELLSFDELTYNLLQQIWKDLPEIDDAILELLTIESKYAGHIERHQMDIDRVKREEALLIPKEFDYSTIASLSNEMKEKLALAKPTSLGSAAKLPGITPAAIIALYAELKKNVTIAA